MLLLLVQVDCNGDEESYFSCGYTRKAAGGTCRRMATVDCFVEEDGDNASPPDGDDVGMSPPAARGLHKGPPL